MTQSLPTVWIMIQINITCVENGDSRYQSYDVFSDAGIIQAETREEVLARAYGIREHNKKFEPNSLYDSGSLIQFVGPFEVPCNKSFTYDDGHIEHYFEEHELLDLSEVNQQINTAAVLYQLIK